VRIYLRLPRIESVTIALDEWLALASVLTDRNASPCMKRLAITLLYGAIIIGPDCNEPGEGGTTLFSGYSVH
jgi:hypothetical protein